MDLLAVHGLTSEPSLAPSSDAITAADRAADALAQAMAGPEPVTDEVRAAAGVLVAAVLSFQGTPFAVLIKDSDLDAADLARALTVVIGSGWTTGDPTAQARNIITTMINRVAAG